MTVTNYVIKPHTYDATYIFWPDVHTMLPTGIFELIFSDVKYIW